MKIGQLKLQSVDKISSDNPQISQIRADNFYFVTHIFSFFVFFPCNKNRTNFLGMNSFSSLQVVGDFLCQI